MSILETILNNMSHPKIMSQNHDLGKINVSDAEVQSAIASLGRVWDAAEMGITQEEAARRIAAADTPEAREQVLVDLKQRAVRRAGLDTSNGRVNVMVAGKPAWHQLGVNVESAVNSEQAIILAGLNWIVAKQAMAYKEKDGVWVESEDTFSLSRQDTFTKLGTVGSRYEVIQNAHGFEFLDSVLGKYGAKYETAGSVYGGEKVWMLVHLPQQAFTVGHTDRVEPYCLFTNPHDGSGKAFCYPKTERVVCANTLRMSGKDKSKGIGIRHTGNVRTKIDDAKSALGIAVEEFKEFKEQADVLSNTKLTDAPGYFNGVLDSVLDMTEAQVLMGSDALAAALKIEDAKEREKTRKLFQKRIDNRETILEDILKRYDSETCGINGMRGTAWSAMNAITEFFDHSPLNRYNGSEETKQSRRLESTISGDGDEMKQIAFSHALAAAKA